MKAAVFAYSRQGCQTARRIRNFFDNAECRAYTIQRLDMPDFLPLAQPSAPLYAELFGWADVLVFVGACGIAVRAIAPYVRDKQTDPAVLCIDEQGQFGISLLSGHIGGANRLARDISAFLHAVPVITTATDINHRFSVDAWAAEQGFLLDSMQAAKAVSAAILERDIPLASDLPITSALPNGILPGGQGDVGIYISWCVRQPFPTTLRVIPPVLHVGIGCRRGISSETIGRVVDRVCSQNGIDIRAVRCAASIDLKADERGLLDFCRQKDWPLSFYSADELLAVQGEFSASSFVRSVTGVDNVCERAALLHADRLIVRKTASDGVTVAIAAENQEVRFG